MRDVLTDYSRLIAGLKKMQKGEASNRNLVFFTMKRQAASGGE